MKVKKEAGMKMKDPTNKELLSILAEHEEAIASLYVIFGFYLPNTKNLWDQLVSDEKDHAAWLKNLRERLDADGMLLNRRQFNTAAVQTSILYVRQRIAEVSAKGITTLRALTIGLDLESSLIEKEFFHVLEADSVEMKIQFNALNDQTAAHRKKIEAYIFAEKLLRRKTGHTHCLSIT
jgi:rubrerythrin